MSRMLITRMNLSFVAIFVLAALTIAQHQQIRPPRAKDAPRVFQDSKSQKRAQGEGGKYTPRVIGHSDSFIIEGVITALGRDNISIAKTDGSRLKLELDEQTTVLESDELISIANMADITLNRSDLRLSDYLEIVVERAGSRNLARIITRIQSSNDQVAKR